MSNSTEDVEVHIKEAEHYPPPSDIENAIWSIGIGLSVQCLILQLALFVRLPRVRKMDQKILTQLTAARLINNIMEFLIANLLLNQYTLDVTYALYMQTDLAMVCWMFVYTRHLYDKVVLVFTLHKWNFIVLSVLIWTLTIPFGVLCPVLLFFDYFEKYYYVCACLKFIVLAANMIFFCRILYVTLTMKSVTSQKNFSEIVKTFVVIFLLFSLTSLQVLLNDLFSASNVKSATNVFFIMNSFQPLVATILFLILTKNSK